MGSPGRGGGSGVGHRCGQGRRDGCAIRGGSGGSGDVPLRRGGFMSGFCPVFSEHRCKNTSQDHMKDIIWVKAYLDFVRFDLNPS